MDENEAQEARRRIKKLCKEHKTNFIDDSFPHSDRSIGKMRCPPLVWLRAHKANTKRDSQDCVWSVFKDPLPSDIDQGVLGNCWLMSALAVISERPDVLEQVVLTKRIDPFGIYLVKLCLDGRWQVIIVDDFFPCHADSKFIAFGVGRRKQLWVSLIEKAYAKYLGSYAALKSGHTIEGLAVLTGAPCENFQLETTSNDEADEIWAKLISLRDAGFPMGCSCGAQWKHVDEAEYEAKGLIAFHAYSILDVRQEGRHRLVKLRNPWGKLAWNGEWSENWSDWTPELRLKFNDSVTELMASRGGNDAGVFWMPFGEFLQHFDSVDVAKIRGHLGWRETRMAVMINYDWNQGAEYGFCALRKISRCIRLTVKEPTEVIAALYQHGARRDREKEDIVLIVVECLNASGAVGECVGRSPRKLSSFVTTGDLFLRPGQYWLVALSLRKFGLSETLETYVAIHSSREVKAELVSTSAKLYRDALIALALREGKSKMDESNPRLIRRFVGKDFAGMLLVVENIIEDSYFHVKCDCTEKSKNVLPTRFSMDTGDSIPPLHRQIVNVLTQSNASDSISYGYELHYKSTRHRVMPLEWGPLALKPHHPPLSGSIALLHEPSPIFI